MANEPKSFMERPPALRGQKLALLVFLLWLPLAVLVLGICALVEVNLILLGVFAVGTVLSLGIGIAALKTA